MNVKFCLVFPREALSVPVMRHVLGDTLRDLGADDDGVADLLLAVTEACSNVVKHGGPGQRYEVLASVGQGGCEVQVVNSGRGSDGVRASTKISSPASSISMIVSARLGIQPPGNT